MITFIKKDNSKVEYNKSDMKKINIYETFIKLTTHDNQDIIIDLSMIDNIEFNNEQVYIFNQNIYLYVYTGKQYDQEMKVDYEHFCDLSEEVPYEDLDENFEWSAKKFKDKKYIVCNGMLEIYTEIK